MTVRLWSGWFVVGPPLVCRTCGLDATRDVDVLGNWDSAGLVVACIEDFPDGVTACIQKVVKNHPDLAGLGANWINLGPRRLAACGLPAGF